ncbi:hypothetical protein HMI54_006689 [Coelomomyces lativittatus]|nr:hypothetical protein HMI56_001883 [Coelomomyces lativittatus]KAJ1517170.1 hypothetical protein HMI54_006689 [Coelomomyces lativittatus]KAJ1518074.1 hypothetical protein HMI55_003289 [Coelomomyces lativittatus]
MLFIARYFSKKPLYPSIPPNHKEDVLSMINTITLKLTNQFEKHSSTSQEPIAEEDSMLHHSSTSSSSTSTISTYPKCSVPSSSEGVESLDDPLDTSFSELESLYEPHSVQSTPTSTKHSTFTSLSTDSSESFSQPNLSTPLQSFDLSRLKSTPFTSSMLKNEVLSSTPSPADPPPPPLPLSSTSTTSTVPTSGLEDLRSLYSPSSAPPMLAVTPDSVSSVISPPPPFLAPSPELPDWDTLVQSIQKVLESQSALHATTSLDTTSFSSSSSSLTLPSPSERPDFSSVQTSLVSEDSTNLLSVFRTMRRECRSKYQLACYVEHFFNHFTVLPPSLLFETLDLAYRLRDIDCMVNVWHHFKYHTTRFEYVQTLSYEFFVKLVKYTYLLQPDLHLVLSMLSEMHHLGMKPQRNLLKWLCQIYLELPEPLAERFKSHVLKLGWKPAFQSLSKVKEEKVFPLTMKWDTSVGNGNEKYMESSLDG